MPVLNRFADLAPDIIAWRRDIHEHPEILFDTHRTSALVAAKLREFGCDEVVEGIGRTGVVGVIRGRETGSGRVIGLRADMDALPMTEITGLPWASRTPGAMHACGHDGHTAMLLGAARYLAETRNFDGAAVVIFQPAEEGGGGGREMVRDGMMERFGIQQVYGMHNMPGIPVGDFHIRPGPMMAAADNFTIHVTGRGSHAAQPHNGVDPVVVASQIVVALQSLVSRATNPLRSAVVSVTSFQTDGRTFNVIPERVELRGTVRTLDPAVQDMIETRLGALVTGTAAALGATAEIDYLRNYPVTANSEAETAFAARVAAEISGEARVETEADPMMGAEDFSFMLNARPGAFIFIGNGDTAKVHHPAYDFNDELIPYGCSYWAKLVETAMPAGAAA
ncbi:M20 aminoacylase family protein [Amaricoccus solimangrovi]|uniref:Amidohydrolase n=1 Tax=Amaricoccus solimangrovi TaxID=2589815 RepID=A0A501W9D2_9RHOB|nr:M20 aminoacylase family protein [Amaricoccus solimangrovi]TPE46553.1 amidohydrolase [Amaricoccus solimangrovi]